MDKRVFIVIPAFNEERAIGSVISGLLNAGYHDIVVVDDCSADNTYGITSQFPVHLLKHSINRGQGAALQTGIDFSLQNGADIIVTFDSDGQHCVEDLPSLLDPILKGDADITMGSRFLRCCKIPFFRKVLLKGSIWVMFLFYRIKMSDAHNGLRALSKNAAKKIDITCDRMAHASEIIEEIHKKQIKFKEIPVTIKYNEETLKKGHGSYYGAIKIFAGMLLKKFGRQ